MRCTIISKSVYFFFKIDHVHCLASSKNKVERQKRPTRTRKKKNYPERAPWHSKFGFVSPQMAFPSAHVLGPHPLFCFSLWGSTLMATPRLPLSGSFRVWASKIRRGTIGLREALLSVCVCILSAIHAIVFFPLIFYMASSILIDRFPVASPLWDGSITSRLAFRFDGNDLTRMFFNVFLVLKFVLVLRLNRWDEDNIICMIS